jgi:hypothetical protein
METLEQAFNEDEPELRNILKSEIGVKKSIKASIIFHAEFSKEIPTGERDLYVVVLRTRTSHLCNSNELSDFLAGSKAEADIRIDDFVNNGSGWVLDQILATDLEIAKCAALNGSCNKLTINYVKEMKKIPIITEEKSQCFFHAIAFHYTNTTRKKTLQTFIKKYINVTIASPVKVCNIKTFEEDNPQLDLKINLLYAEDEEIYPLYISKNFQAKNRINLLLYKTMIKNEVVNHYAYIEDLSALLKKRYHSEDKDGKKKKTYYYHNFCPNCLTPFWNHKKCDEHLALCSKGKPQKIILPEKGDCIEFKNFNKKYKTPYIGFFDLEAIQTNPVDKCESCAKSKKKTPCAHKSIVKSIQKPITFSAIILDNNNKIIFNKCESGEDCVEKMIDELLNVEETLLTKLREVKKMNDLTANQEYEISIATVCHICEKDLLDDKVLDHDHLSGEFIGVAHSSCNLNRNTKYPFIPMFCHNLEGYDSHFILQKMKKDPRLKRVTGIPHNTERFKTLTINSYVFLDSMAFLPTSLATLAENLAADKSHPFNILDQMKLYNSSNKSKLKPLLLRKGLYPYEFATGLDVLRNTKSIPGIDKFNSLLTGSKITTKEHNHAKKVFQEFKCESMLSYTELYCKNDVALLAEIMLQFRTEILNQFGLDCW